MSLGNGRGSRVIGRGSRFGSRGRGSKVEVEGQKSRSRVKSRGSKVENTTFLSILKVLQPLNAAKQLVLLSKLKNFANGYALWLYVLYNYMYCITESFVCELMRGLMFESIHLLFYNGV